MKSKFYILLTMLLACTLQVKAEVTTEVIKKEVGTNNSGSKSAVLYPYYKNSGSQTLYLSSEIGQAGIISEISYYVNSYGSKILKGRLKIYMVETDITALTTSNHIASKNNMTLVYDSGVDSYYGPTGAGWETFTLTNPFCYGGKNLIVATEVTKNDFTSNWTYSVSSISNRSIIRHSDDNPEQSGNAFDENTTYTTNSGSTSSYAFSAQNVPYTQFTFKATGTKYGTETTCGNLYFGYSTYGQNTATQHLYLNTEVGKSGIINNLAFQVYSSATTELNHSVKIYMAEVAQTSLTAPLSTSNMTLVFDGTVKLGGKQTGDWIGVDLTSPFLYTGMGSLVVAISNTESTSNSGHRFMTTSVTGSKRTVLTGSSSDPNKATITTSAAIRPNALFSFAIHGNCSSYSEDGFGICPNCETELKYVFETPTDVDVCDYAITNVGKLMWVSSRVNKGLADLDDYFFISDDIDLTGYNWIPIGTDSNPLVSRIYGYDYSSKEGNTISGIPSTSSLVGTLSGGALYSLRLTSGTLVNKGVSGTIGQCLTLGSALLRSGSATIEKSYYLSTSSSSAEIGPRSLEQMQSGQVTYELNSYPENKVYGKGTWYQTLGTDDYPMYNSSSENVFRYTQCSGTSFGYSNTASLSGTVQSHTYTNSVCSECNAQPTTFSENIVLSRSYPYNRTVQAKVTNGKELKFMRSPGESYVGKWIPLYVPFSFAVDANTYDLAEIQGFGVIEDTNGDGAVNTQDEKKLIVSYLNNGDVTTPNKPYMFRLKSYTSVTFTSTDGILYPNTVNEQTFSTMKDQIVITPTYTKTTTSGVQKQLVSGALMSSAGYLYPFSWKATPSYKNGNAWDQSTINIFAHRFGLTELVDNDNLSSDFVPYTQALEEVVDNLWYERTFVERQAHNWQSMYLPFDVTVEDSGDDVYPKYATFESITTEGGVDYINIKKCVKGDVIKANTPALICVDAAKTLTYDYPLVTLKPASSATSTVFNSSLATYTLVGSYAPYQSSSEWYAISKKDGDFHPMTATAKLPPYRFYMTIVKKSSGAGELRVVIRDIDEVATAIDSVFGEEDTDAIYTLDGRKVQEESLQPGIYVKNGKKISIKK